MALWRAGRWHSKRFQASRCRVSGSSERLWKADLQARDAPLARGDCSASTPRLGHINGGSGGRVRTSLPIRGAHKRGGGGRCERFRVTTQTLKLGERADLSENARGGVHEGWKNNQCCV